MILAVGLRLQMLEFARRISMSSVFLNASWQGLLHRFRTLLTIIMMSTCSEGLARKVYGY